ncbi:MAG: diguanylate cyclase [Tissierellales bacterium]|nr:diguanylate cyclase [Tissierellales bacterium]MBN2826663.1 diguanylate cyclase [Tissierellales bacterium]
MGKHKKNKGYTSHIAVILLLAILVFLTDNVPVKDQGSVQGLADLSSWQQQEVLNLSGEWLYYPSSQIDDIVNGKGKLSVLPEIVTVPHFWEKSAQYNNKPFGYGTYQLDIIGLQAGQIYAIKMLDASSAYRLTINGKDIMSNGLTGISKETYVPQWKMISNAFTADDQGRALILIEVSNFDYLKGGLWEAPQLGSYQTIHTMMLRHLAIEEFFIFSLVTLGLLFLLMHQFYNEDMQALYLGVVSLLTSLRVMTTGHRLIIGIFEQIPWELMVRLDYLSGYLMLPAFGFLFNSLGYVKPNPTLERIYRTTAIGMILMSLFMPIEVYYNFIEIYKMMIIVFSLYCGYQVYMGWRKKIKGSDISMIAYAVLLLGAWWEVFVARQTFVLPVAIFIVISLTSIKVIEDLMTTRKIKQKLEVEVITDSLTGLYSRSYLDKILKTGYEKKKISHKLFVLFIDIDKFKDINDTYGHAIGDEVLSIVSARLRNLFRATDALFRFGGDEFIVITEIGEHEDIHQIVNRVREKFRNAIVCEENQILVKLSIGYAEYSPEEHALEDAIKRSDESMYWDKKKNA